jgi:4-hydroxy-tetrahydrodipicolinate synthase
MKMKKTYSGCWPTMITPFTDDDKVDFKAIRKLVDWYVDRGADGIFSVCQSSEMFYLTLQEKLDIAKAVVDANQGRIRIIASGHTADDHQQQIDELGAMARTGVDAVVLVSNRMARKEDGSDVFDKNADDIFRQLPDVTFGLYECPFPYLRLLTDEFLGSCARSGKLVFLKDVSCSKEIEKRRVQVVNGTGLSLFCANTATLLDALQYGYSGYNGVMGNFHIDIYKWLYENFKLHPEKARYVMDWLTMAAVTEARCYPVNAKYHCQLTGIPMSLHTRSKDVSLLNENCRMEIESLIRLETRIRTELGLKA